MTGIRFAFMCACLALVLVGCTSDNALSVNEEVLAFETTAPDGAVHAKRMVSRPFKGSVDVETIMADGPYLCMLMPEEFCALRCPNATKTPTWVIGFTAQGHATHLGRFRASAEHCSDVVFDPTTMAPVSAVYGDGEFEIVAANGDQMFGTYGSYGVDGDGVADTIAPGVADFHDRVSLAGGTGRFVNATGVLQEDGLFDVATGAITYWTMHGEIRYAAADRSGR